MKKQMNTPLFKALLEHNKKNPISFHVPGHKNGQNIQSEANHFFEQILKMDVTELSGLDDLHSPEGVILEAEQLLAELFQTRKSFFLVNGSTVGNLAMIMAACRENDTVLVQRNCHKSVLNALRLAKVRPIFLEPEYDHDWKVATCVNVDTVKEAIGLYSNVKAIILTYPNYYGIVSDLEGIIKEAHLHHIPVLVDEAHGAHFNIGHPFPASAVQLGADIVVQSAHKTLPAMTMGSYLHVNGHLVDINKVKDYLQIFQSSSPSYPIMASLDLARKYLATYTQQDLDALQKSIKHFKAELADIPEIKVLAYPNHQGDLLKVTIQTRSNISGFELQKRLEEEAVYTELADPYNVLLVLPLLKEGQRYPFEVTARKIKKVCKDLPFHEQKSKLTMSNRKVSGLAIPYKEMDNLESMDVPIAEAIGFVCAETIIPYPPGIPLLLKGEEITNERVNQLQRLLETGARFQGGSLLTLGKVKVFIKNKK
ncbi:arginine/lysine/ornithine decarboxylase [Bacillus sp. SLBN-46]|jgi:arginine/lysine/ornithine decarboxylase|uniref:aminotransferase class I/II-fold pyridoxal phosphate-dependent enzyme n=1 Tax=Bacillus sp. SLBN-46 TaxID=3042283 RepID=UPI0028583DA2|nr:aminotransferase class I/II-fold pyridoxal phosphate-dependent enzyme [Bacillus sp. SLBN-46]MDR6120802.1 arginine/lysine/ornithine decarboxylase [Bacillus sp. SLBN-46]